MPSTRLHPAEEGQLRGTLEAAGELARGGQLPFAARLVAADGSLHLATTNQAQATGDPTAHAEMVLIRRASESLSAAQLRGMTIYAAAEPCVMCAAAIVFCGVGRLVYGMSAERLAPQLMLPPGVIVPGITGRQLLDATRGGPLVMGPLLEAEAQALLFPSSAPVP
jgi:tRNA(Arg) A34 adenosine deaminase TadA